MINHFQNKRFFCIIYVCVLCTFIMYINTHTQYIFWKYLLVYTFIYSYSYILYYIYIYIHKHIFLKYIHACVCIYIYIINDVTWRDIRPSMVTHTRNLCSAFNPSKVHTHSSEHTPGAVGSHLCCGARGAVGGSVPCSRAPQSWYWGWRECSTFTPPTYNSCRPETRTRNLSITSPNL